MSWTFKSLITRYLWVLSHSSRSHLVECRHCLCQDTVVPLILRCPVFLLPTPRVRKAHPEPRWEPLTLRDRSGKAEVDCYPLYPNLSTSLVR